MPHFEKVSRERFREDIFSMTTLFDVSTIDEIYDDLKLPKRATIGSAGYDFYLPLGVRLEPGQTAKIPTGIRVKMDPGMMLAIFPRSGLGFKYRLQLDNTVGIVDSDYYESDNEGHIFIKITNDSKKGDELQLWRDAAFAQGIFLPYFLTDDDDAEGVRNGGFGSTSK